MQFKVPQNITMEDRIAGPLTLVQFIMAIIGGGFAFLVLNLRSLAPLNTVGAGVIALLTAVIVLGKFNDQPMYKFVRFIFVFLFTPKTRVWHKAGSQVQLVKPSQKKENDDVKRSTKHVTKADIARLAAVIDSRGTVGGKPTPGANPR